MTHLYKIKNKQGRLVTFKPNKPQLQHLAEKGNHRYNFILKARQFGFTTLYCIDLLDEALWNPGTTCAILAHERDAVLKIFQIVKRAYDNLNDDLKPKTRYDTKLEYAFTERFDGVPLDSAIYVALKVRSGTVQKLHITESAYIKDRQELKAGSKQAVPLTGSISEETTGNGFNEFYDDYIFAKDSQFKTPYDYRSYFYPWVSNPEYTLPGELVEITNKELKIREIAKKTFNIDVTDGMLLWRSWKMRELLLSQSGAGLTGAQLFKQEYPLTISEAFQSGAGQIFDIERIENIQPPKPLTESEGRKWLVEKYPNNPVIVEKFVKLHRKQVKFWHLPEPNKKYVSGVDPSGGQGADYGAIDIWDDDVTIDDPIRQLCQYYGKLRADELADLTKEIAVFYNRAYVGVENNMMSTILFLSKIYDNYYFQMRQDEKTLKRTRKIGFNTNSKTRDIMIDEYLKLFDESNLQINSTITLSEMRTFVKKDNGKREHADGKHDDALFAGFIAMQMRKLKRSKARVFKKNPLN